MNISFMPERIRRQSAARVRQFHWELIEAGLADHPGPARPALRRRPFSLRALLGFAEKPADTTWVDMTGAFGRRRQMEDAAPPTFSDRLRDMLRF